MATVQGERAISINAGSDLSAAEFLAVKLSSGQLAVSGAGDGGIGILTDKPAAAGRPGRVVIGGQTKAIAGAAVSEDDKLTTDADGKLVTATTGTTVIGEALEDGVEDQRIEFLLVSSYVLP